MSSTNQNTEIGAIFGTGRSGTTWLGSMVSSHPEVVYRFEPFHRLRNKEEKMREACQLIESDAFSNDDLTLVYDALLPAYPECEKSPFFTKDFSMKLSWGQSITSYASRKSPLMAQIYRYLYTPTERPMLIFKEVDLGNMVLQFLLKTTMPVVYIVRHPCAVVSSHLEGQKKSLMPSARRTVLKDLLEKNSPTLAQKYASNVSELSIVEQEALLWRLDVDRVVRACQDQDNGLLVIYEALTLHPLEIAQKVFAHFGLQMTPQTQTFIEESTQSDLSTQAKRGDQFINSYFTVYRDPQVAREQWKTRLSAEEQEKIRNIVRDSEVFTLAVEQGLW